jgi:tRNA A-37 threonylcarbamoyl transferase component Bud32
MRRMVHTPLEHGPTLRASTADGSGERLGPGAKVGDYVVDRYIGAGAMGEVYAGTHPLIGKRVAIKLLKRELSASAEGAERFLREARAVNQVDHPHVIDVFAFGRLDDGRLYLVMDLVDGRSLRATLEDGPLDVATALDILGQVADALDAAHARGVVHRDLKPDNIVIAKGAPPRVFVLDFGIAKLVKSAAEASGNGTLTGQGTWLGTPGYMAPEQWSADGAGPASDRYALGVMAFELLSGKLPFSAPSLPAMMEQHFRAPVPALSTKGAVAALSTFDPVLARAMAKDPDARYASARELVDALRAASGGRAKRPATAAKKLWLPAALGGGVLALAVGAVLVSRGGGEHRDRPAAAAEGMIHVDVYSVPDGAEVSRSGKLVGTTNHATVDARPGEAIAVEIRKPGYRSEHRELVAPDKDARVDVTLAAESGFEGVWRLPTGELRAFKRSDERVEAYKLDSVSGPREFFRNYELRLADTGVAFVGHEEYVDPRVPNDPRCHVQLEVDYHYEPKTDELALRRQKAAIDIRDGHCVLAASQTGEAKRLTRVDRDVSDARWTEAPAGKPTFDKTVPNDSMDNYLDGAKSNAKRIKQAEQAKKTLKRPPDIKQVGNLPSQTDSQIPPQVQQAPIDPGTQQAAPIRKK